MRSDKTVQHRICYIRTYTIFALATTSRKTFARELAKKVGKSVKGGERPADLGAVAKHALQLRLPKVVPGQWSKYEEIDRVFDHLASRFAEAAPQLRPQGFICTVQRNQDRLRVRVERGGSTVFGVNIGKGGGMGDDPFYRAAREAPAW
jgi:hypothetical protein